MLPSTTLITVEDTRMAENTVRLQAWCSAARQVFNAAGRRSSGDSDFQLKHIHASVRRSLHGARAVNLALVNGQTSLMTLPDRVLRQILLQVALRDRLTLAAACKHLHKRCNALALYRPTIHVCPSDFLLAYKPSTSSLEHGITIARQSMPDDLESVTLTWWPELSNELGRFLSGNLARVRSLKVYLPFTIFREPDYATEIFAALATPAPVLARLHITVETGIFSGGTAPTTIDAFADPLVARHLSSLRRLYISGMHLVMQSGLVFADVREFCWSHSAPAILTRATLVSLVKCFPRLETLRMRSGRISWAHASLPVRSSLRHVYVDRCDQIDYVNLQGFLEATRIPLLTLTYPEQKTLLESLARASASVSYGCMFFEFTLKAPPRAGRTVPQVVQYLTPTKLLRLERQRFLTSLRHVTYLALLELFWPQPAKTRKWETASGPAISFPALTHLRISLAPCRSRRILDDEYVGGILLGLDGPLSPFQTPALRNLEVSYYALPGTLSIDPFVETDGFRKRACFCRRTLSISLFDLHRFVTSCILLPNGRRLEQIRVNGVEVIDPDPFPCIGLLEQLAAVVSVSSVPKPNSCDLGADLWESNVMYLP